MSNVVGPQAGPVLSTHPGAVTGGASTQYSPWCCCRWGQYSPWWGHIWGQYSVLTLMLLQAVPVLSTHPGVATGGASTQYSPWCCCRRCQYSVLSTAAGGASTQYSPWCCCRRCRPGTRGARCAGRAAPTATARATSSASPSAARRRRRHPPATRRARRTAA